LNTSILKQTNDCTTIKFSTKIILVLYRGHKSAGTGDRAICLNITHTLKNMEDISKDIHRAEINLKLLGESVILKGGQG